MTSIFDSQKRSHNGCEACSWNMLPDTEWQKVVLWADLERRASLCLHNSFCWKRELKMDVDLVPWSKERSTEQIKWARPYLCRDVTEGTRGQWDGRTRRRGLGLRTGKDEVKTEVKKGTETVKCSCVAKLSKPTKVNDFVLFRTWSAQIVIIL